MKVLIDKLEAKKRQCDIMIDLIKEGNFEIIKESNPLKRMDNWQFEKISGEHKIIYREYQK